MLTWDDYDQEENMAATAAPEPAVDCSLWEDARAVRGARDQGGTT